MWYAVWVKSGEEEKVRTMCRRMIYDFEILEKCVIPRYECMKRYQGRWHKTQALLYPGYLFMQSSQPEQLYGKLKEIPEFARILGDEEMFISLYEHETQFLENGSGDSCVLEMSYGCIVGDQVMITKGPLKNYAGRIKRIDRHKRLAVLETSFFGNMTEVRIGLEIVKKVHIDPAQ